MRPKAPPRLWEEGGGGPAGQEEAEVARPLDSSYLGRGRPNNQDEPSKQLLAVM